MDNATKTHSLRRTEAQPTHHSRGRPTRNQRTIHPAPDSPEQGQALVKANLTRTVYRELPDLPAVTEAAQNEQPPATADTEEVRS